MVVNHKLRTKTHATLSRTRSVRTFLVRVHDEVGVGRAARDVDGAGRRRVQQRRAAAAAARGLVVARGALPARPVPVPGPVHRVCKQTQTVFTAPNNCHHCVMYKGYCVKRKTLDRFALQVTFLQERCQTEMHLIQMNFENDLEMQKNKRTRLQATEQEWKTSTPAHNPCLCADELLGGIYRSFGWGTITRVTGRSVFGFLGSNFSIPSH